MIEWCLIAVPHTGVMPSAEERQDKGRMMVDQKWLQTCSISTACCCESSSRCFFSYMESTITNTNITTHTHTHTPAVKQPCAGEWMIPAHDTAACWTQAVGLVLIVTDRTELVQASLDPDIRNTWRRVV